MRKILIAFIFVLLLVVISPFVYFGIYLATSGGTGSMEKAVRLRALIEPISDPESGEGCDREYGYLFFNNGEWILGIGRDSHAMMSKYRGGGTLVFKDSRGQIRCFFGHICGNASHVYTQSKSLDEFYKKITDDYQLIEQQWP